MDQEQAEQWIGKMKKKKGGRLAMLKYCEGCQRLVKGRVVEKLQAFPVRGEWVEVRSSVLTCRECGEEIFCRELDERTLKKVYEVYRERHDLAGPEEIYLLRHGLVMTQEEFSRLCKISVSRLRSLERGGLCTQEENQVMARLKDPEGLKDYLREASLREEEKERLQRRLPFWEAQKQWGEKLHVLSKHLGEKASLENGLRPFDYEKFSSMVLYFLRRGGGMPKVKLCKLLNYSDMVSFRDNGLSISGARYVHYAYGPVPDGYYRLFELMQAQGLMYVKLERMGGDFFSHWAMAGEEVDPSVLSQSDISVMDKVYERFEGFGSRKISEYSHRETGYRSTRPGQLISYGFARDLSF